MATTSSTSHTSQTGESLLKLNLIKLITIKNKIVDGLTPNPFLMGKRTVYGVMPDWNPAEIIGIRPKPLALSLYSELITDSIWAYQGIIMDIVIFAVIH